MAKRPIVLVTGGSGFIGRALIQRLSESYTGVALDRPGDDDGRRENFVPIDLGDDNSVRKALDEVRDRYGGRIVSVVHLAAYYDISGEPNPLYEKITVKGTRRLIDGLKDFQVEQFVFASTMLVHRPTCEPDTQINEDSPIGPTWAYPQSKAQTERLLRDRHGQIPLVLLRIAAVYDDLGHSPFIAQQIARIYEHRLTAHIYPGMLCTAQSFVHLGDLTDAILRVIDRRKELPPELPILIGEEDALEYEETQDIIGVAMHGEDWTTLRIPKPVAELGVWLQKYATGGEAFIQPWMVEESNAHYILDAHRARELLGWSPKHSLSDTLPKMVADLKRDPQGWYRTNNLDASLVAWYGAPPTKQKAGDKHEDSGMAGLHADHMAMMEEGERKKRWVHFANIGLGLWLAASPLVLGIAGPADVPETVRAITIDRGLPPIEWRSLALAWTSVAAGLLIAIFGALSLSKRTAWFSQWANCVLGLALLFAPLVFWAPSPAIFANHLMVGTAVIAFSVLVPMMPGMDMAGIMDRKVIPPGWTYCPSTVAQRFPIVVMGIIGLLTALQLTAYQLGFVGHL